MKRINFLKNAALSSIVCLSIVMTSCSKEKSNEIPVKEKSIAEIVISTPDFSLLKAAVVHAGLAETLSSKGPFTVFAPTNAAFEEAGLATEAKIKALPAETIKSILLYHVLGSSVQTSAIPTKMNNEVETIENKKPFITKNDKGVMVNEANVLQADVKASNGYIHSINKVLMPADKNIVELAQSDENFSYLVAAVLRASEGSLNVAEVLSGTGPFTVFAPTNQAFIDAGFATIADIQAADPATLTSILTYHVISGRIFSTDLVNGSEPTTVNGDKLMIDLSNGAKVKGNGNQMASKITTIDLLATNGIVHVIDQVLLP